MLTRWRCERIERQSLQPGDPSSPLELMAVVLRPAPVQNAESPNRKVWLHGIALGELRIGGLEAAWVAAHFDLHREYYLELTALNEEEPTRKT